MWTTGVIIHGNLFKSPTTASLIAFFFFSFLNFNRWALRGRVHNGSQFRSLERRCQGSCSRCDWESLALGGQRRRWSRHWGRGRVHGRLLQLHEAGGPRSASKQLGVCGGVRWLRRGFLHRTCCVLGLNLAFQWVLMQSYSPHSIFLSNHMHLQSYGCIFEGGSHILFQGNKAINLAFDQSLGISWGGGISFFKSRATFGDHITFIGAWPRCVLWVGMWMLCVCEREEVFVCLWFVVRTSSHRTISFTHKPHHTFLHGCAVTASIDPVQTTRRSVSMNVVLRFCKMCLNLSQSTATVHTSTSTHTTADSAGGFHIWTARVKMGDYLTLIRNRAVGWYRRENQFFNAYGGGMWVSFER